jgi:hypothetical protein
MSDHEGLKAALKRIATEDYSKQKKAARKISPKPQPSRALVRKEIAGTHLIVSLSFDIFALLTVLQYLASFGWSVV